MEFTLEKLDKNKGGCMGFELANGKKINPDKDGHIRIDDPKIEKAIKSSEQYKKGWIADRYTAVATNGSEGKLCNGCSFNAFLWQRECPRCNGTTWMPEE